MSCLLYVGEEGGSVRYEVGTTCHVYCMWGRRGVVYGMR